MVKYNYTLCRMYVNQGENGEKFIEKNWQNYMRVSYQ